MYRELWDKENFQGASRPFITLKYVLIGSGKVMPFGEEFAVISLMTIVTGILFKLSILLRYLLLLYLFL